MVGTHRVEFSVNRPESVSLIGSLRTYVVLKWEQNDAGTGRLKHAVSETGCLREWGVDLAGNKSQARPNWVDGREERLTRRHVEGKPALIPEVECRLRDSTLTILDSRLQGLIKVLGSEVQGSTGCLRENTLESIDKLMFSGR